MAILSNPPPTGQNPYGDPLAGLRNLQAQQQATRGALSGPVMPMASGPPPGILSQPYSQPSIPMQRYAQSVPAQQPPPITNTMGIHPQPQAPMAFPAPAGGSTRASRLQQFQAMIRAGGSRGGGDGFGGTRGGTPGISGDRGPSDGHGGRAGF